MTNRGGAYTPAFGYDKLTPLYDPLLRWVLREATFKQRVIREARINRGQRILDLGCGTGTLAILVKHAHPEAQVVGIDADRNVLRMAKAKAGKAGTGIFLNCGMAFKLPYRDSSFDRVLSSLVFHHLTRENKILTLREVFRVLHPGGGLHVADFGKPGSGIMRAAFMLVQLLDGFETTADNVNGLLPGFLRKTGFVAVAECVRYTTPFGTLSLYQAQKPIS